MYWQALNPCLQHGSALLHLPAAWIHSLLGAPPLDPWGLHLKSLQIIGLIRSAFDGNVTFVFSYRDKPWTCAFGTVLLCFTCLQHRFSACWGLCPLDPWGLHPNTHYIVNPSTHHIVNLSTHHTVNPSTHHYQLSCCLYIHYHVYTIYPSVLFTYISTFTSHSHFTSNAHFIIFLSIVCYIFTSPHFCVLLWYFHNFHMSLFPSFNTFLFHHLSIYPFSCLSTSHIFTYPFPFLSTFTSNHFHVYSFLCLQHIHMSLTIFMFIHFTFKSVH